jgi:hypothetical protein
VYAHGERWAQLTRAERRALLVGNSLEHDEEDIKYWRHASDEQRGEALYGLLVFAAEILRSRSPLPEEPLLFPGFPKRRDNARSANR